MSGMAKAFHPVRARLTGPFCGILFLSLLSASAEAFPKFWQTPSPVDGLRVTLAVLLVDGREVYAQYKIENQTSARQQIVLVLNSAATLGTGAPLRIGEIKGAEGCNGDDPAICLQRAAKAPAVDPSEAVTVSVKYTAAQSIPDNATAAFSLKLAVRDADHRGGARLARFDFPLESFGPKCRGCVCD